MITSSPLSPARPVRWLPVVYLMSNSFKRLTDLRVVIDADHHPALSAPHEVSHGQVLVELETHAVPRSLPVGRGHVMERMRTVVPLGTFEPRQVLNINTS